MKRESHKSKVSVQPIPFLDGRPKRSRIIDNEDLVNLKIALETCKTIEEFLERM